jgi:hypothetical protein
MHIQEVYQTATIQNMIIDAQFLDHWYEKHGSFIDDISSNKKQWPKLPITSYQQYGKDIYIIHISPTNQAIPDHYHLIAVPTSNSGLKGNGCICLDNYHNIYKGMSEKCNNSGQKC